MKTHNKQSIACNMIALSATMLSCYLAVEQYTRGSQFADTCLWYDAGKVTFKLELSWNDTTSHADGLRSYKHVHQPAESDAAAMTAARRQTSTCMYPDEPTL